ncbi:hypothetical protein EYR40_010379 [Pleurotus pulmonarius]|nr:hypothetical protein EYR36_010230 [Pleurotus pulmonarius]KAF4588824.1 hypothetical protein EYR40_010379 [Pleurotus pulmonarius]
MDHLKRRLTSSSYTPHNHVLPDDERIAPLVRITENALPGSTGNNDAIETNGDAYGNMAILKVIMDYLHSVREELGYDDSKMYACAAFVYARLISNDTLARIYYKQGHTDPESLSIGCDDRRECEQWISRDLKGKAPKVLADLFEANVWLIYHSTFDGYRTLCDYFQTILGPLLPVTITMFEAAYRSTYKWEIDSSGSSNFFLYRTRSYREADARKVNAVHAEHFLRLLGYTSGELKDSPVGNLARSLEGGPPMHFDRDGRIQGSYKYMQLEGHTTLYFFLAQAHDQIHPLHRSAVTRAAGIQTLLFRLASSDVGLHHLVKALGMEAALRATGSPHEIPAHLSSRSAAEIFVASIILLQSKSRSKVSFKCVMQQLAALLVQCAVTTLKHHAITIQPLLPASEEQVNTLPQTRMGRPHKALPRSRTAF